MNGAGSHEKEVEAFDSLGSLALREYRDFLDIWIAWFV